MRSRPVSRPLIGPRLEVSLPWAAAIFAAGLLGFWLLGMQVPRIVGWIADGWFGPPCWNAAHTADIPPAAIPACMATHLQGFARTVVHGLSHPDAAELAEARQTSTQAWLGALAQAAFNMLVVAAFALGLIGLWATIALRLSARLRRRRRDRA
ncbi:MAG: hypothetical protein KGL12_03980 [Rhodospirillales bacterium]|nr:hypothetical protein [Rhodospirillales bacterium]